VFWHKKENVAVCFLKTSVNSFGNESIINIKDYVEGSNLEKYNFSEKAYLFRFKSQGDMELFFSRIETLAKQGMFESDNHKELFAKAIIDHFNSKKDLIVEENNIFFNMEDDIKNNIEFLTMLANVQKNEIYDLLLKTEVNENVKGLGLKKVTFEDTMKSKAVKQLIYEQNSKEEL